MSTIIVSRHDALVAAIIAHGLASNHTPVLRHVDDPAQIADADVIGTIPPHLAICAATLTPVCARNLEHGHICLRTVAVRQAPQPERYSVAFVPDYLRERYIRDGVLSAQTPWRLSYVGIDRYDGTDVFGAVPYASAARYRSVTQPYACRSMSDRLAERWPHDSTILTYRVDVVRTQHLLGRTHPTAFAS